MALAIGSWTQQNSQWCYFAWENLQWGFCDVGCCSLFIVVLHSLMSLHFRAISPCHRHSTLASQACEGLHQLWALPWLLSIAFAFSSSAMIVSGKFLPTGIFYLTLLSPTFLTLTCFYQGLTGSRQFFLEVCRASWWSSKHRPGQSVWFTTIHNLHI